MNKKKIVILCEDLYEENELWYPYYRLLENGCEVTLVGTKKTEYIGKNGMPVKVGKLISEIKSEEIDGVIIPGGYAPDRLRRFQEVNDLVKNLFESKKLVASICHGPWVLVSARILAGRTVTCFSSIRDDVVNAGAVYVDEAVVEDGNLITSRTPADLPVFLKSIIAFLEEDK